MSIQAKDALPSMPANDPIVSAQALRDMLDAEGTHVVVVDCRHQLSDPEYGRREFARGHIPGAHFAHLDEDLSGEIKPGITGRHPLPAPEEFVELLGGFGVNPDTTIVCYDDKSGAIAARCWWMCRWIGHSQSFVLDGGIQAWISAGGPLSTEEPVPAKGHVTRNTPGALVIDADAIQAGLASGDLVLVDARAPERFRGENEPIDSVAGHIPGAINVPFAGNLDTDGYFLGGEALSDRFAKVLSDAKRTAVYCGSGVTAAHNILAMERALLVTERAALTPPILYAGSWSDWITDPRRPVATDQ